MSKLKVHTGRETYCCDFKADENILDVLERNGINIRVGCNALGACGLCIIRVIEGNLNELTANELMFIDKEELSRGMRLACQLQTSEDLTLDVSDNIPESRWKELEVTTQGNLLSAQGVNHPFGVAVDIGTTQIKAMLCNRVTGQEHLSVFGPNPQNVYGADVITRLVKSKDSEHFLNNMNRRVIDAIGEAITELSQRITLNPQHITKVLIVGNTAMLTLLTKKNGDLLLKPEQWNRYIDCLSEETGNWATHWGIDSQAIIDIVPSLGGFIGSDLIAGIEAAGIIQSRECKLFIDVGTNTEIALWDGQTLWVTSCAGGPAFEGSGIGCGMPYDIGSIYGVIITQGHLEFQTVGNITPKGICGSGIVDLIASLLKLKIINSKGNFTSFEQEYLLNFKGSKLRIIKKDIDVIQRAKASIGAGISTLMTNADIHSDELRRVYLTGHFGSGLNINHAQEIGLIPTVNPEIVSLLKNSALVGAAKLLLSEDAREHVSEIQLTTKIINLAQSTDFEERFLEGLFLRPMEVS
ncbi:putative metal-binding protein [Candidatus Desulfosporosinus infrequens]|uniref:Putative metal-binding protein n=1 Tax=Candidatus Desulfosporosinus infrequens TaxID=2043169 RepID=A0A2U3KXH7_9FIRM|nr:putative metal-binding protein [Candidatus Desulfosporosinus infrequens]